MSGSREVHVAGAPLEIKTRARQRCAWCGRTLKDAELSDSRHEEREDGMPGEPFYFWEPGALIAVVGDTTWQLPFDPQVDKVPLDCCASLDPDITK